MGGKTSRTKGHGYERKIAQWWQGLGWVNARRLLEYQDGEANGIDIKNTEPFFTQCKRGKKYAPITALEEIKLPGAYYVDNTTHATHRCVPLLITKADNKPDVAVLYLSDLEELLRGYYAI